jgi:chromosome segregation ATPase
MAIQRPSGAQDPGGQGWLADQAATDRFQSASTPTLQSSSTALGDASILLSMESQLVSLYAERSQLHTALGISDAEEVVALIEQLRAQIGQGGSTDGPSVPELENKIAELDRWAAELRAKAAELEAKERELAGIVSVDESPELLDARQALNAHAAEIDARDSEVEQRAIELERRSSQLDVRDGELDSRQAELDARQLDLETGRSSLQDGHLELDAERAELDQLKAELDQRRVEMAQRQADLAAREADLANREAGVLAPSMLTSVPSHIPSAVVNQRSSIRSIIEQGPLFDKVRSLESHLESVYGTIDRLTDLLSVDGSQEAAQ